MPSSCCDAGGVTGARQWDAGGPELLTVPCSAAVSAAQAGSWSSRADPRRSGVKGGVEVGDWARPLVKLGCDEGKGAVPGGE